VNLQGDSSATPPVPANPLEKLLNDLETPAFKSDYVYTYTNSKGETEEIYCITDISEIISNEKVKKQELESRKIIKEKEIASQAELVNAHRKLIYDEQKKLEDEDNKINEIVKAQIVAKQTKLDNLKVGDSDFK
jgi:hypothetical protein